VAKCVTLITGASSGIGADLARIFAANGHHVALVARRADRLNNLAAAIIAAGGTPPLVIPCDLTQPDAGDIIAAALAAAGVEVDTLVNNAGFGLFGPSLALDRAQQLDMIAVNIRALTDLSLRFSDSLIRHRGGLLNVASIAAFLPGPGMAVYYASKAYVLSFSDALHNELGRHGVRVTALCPGPVPTEFQSRAGFTAGMDSAMLNVSAYKVALAGYRGLMRGKRVVLPGLGIRAIPFLLRFVPRGFVLMMVGLIQRNR
jgi:short-subunit dehydrogenase